jgi:CBS domain-containing protein
VRLRIRRQETIDAHGSTGVARLVFCPARQCSRRLDECQRCPHLLRLDGSAVECAPVLLESEARGLTADPGLGGDICVGEAMGGRAVSIAAGTPLSAAVEVLARASVAFAIGIVVDDDDRVIGTIEGPNASLGADVVSTGQWARPVAPIRESATLADAVARMAKERRRALPVVDGAGRVVGLISDIDALHWVARQKARP